MVVKKILPWFALVAIISTLVTVAGCAVITGSGNVVTREFVYGDFTRIEIGYAFDAEISQADSYLVKISLDDNLFDYLDIHKSGDTLRITMEPGNIYSKTQQQVVINLPDLERLKLSGASKAVVAGFASSHSLEMEISGASKAVISDVTSGDTYLEISGASNVEGSVTMKDVVFNVSGASFVTLEGTAENMSLDASGGSDVDLSGLTLDNAWVTLSGASQAEVNVSGQLNGDLSGASILEYLGDPTIGSITSSGGSVIKPK